MLLPPQKYKKNHCSFSSSSTSKQPTTSKVSVSTKKEEKFIRNLKMTKKKIFFIVRFAHKKQKKLWVWSL
jgi:hypothetical protein